MSERCWAAVGLGLTAVFVAYGVAALFRLGPAGPAGWPL